MKIKELYESLIGEHKSGSYVDMRLDDKSKDKIGDLIRDIGLDNPTPRDKLHVTLMYSKKPSSKFYERSEKSVKVGNKYSLQWFGENKDALVLVLEDADDLHKRHSELKAYGMEHSWPDYSPHVTLAYKQDSEVGLPDMREYNLGSLRFVDEQINELDLNWKEKLDD